MPPVRSGGAVAQRDRTLDHRLHGFDHRVGDDVAHERLGTFAHHRGAGLDRVDADPGALELDRERVGDPVERGLRRAVHPDGRCDSLRAVRRAGGRARGGARQVDDPALTALAHLRDHGLREIDRRVQVHLEHDAATTQRVLERRLVDRRRRVVDEDVDPTAEQVERGGNDRGAAVGVGEVGRHGFDRGAVSATAGERLVEAPGEVLVPVDGARGDRRRRLPRQRAVRRSPRRCPGSRR